MSAARMRMRLEVNGEAHEVLAPAGATLLDVLRNSLGLTGTKCGCNQGVCGACTVLLDGKLARSCLSLAVDVGERSVTTVEGVSGGEAFSAVQRALIDAGAIQCGFCTPGFVIALSELLARDPHPDLDAIRTALSGNLCRCSGYAKIVDAAMQLAARAP